MLLALLLAAASLDAARAHLKAGKLDSVLTDLYDTDGNPAEEARILTAAAERAHARKDEPLALQLAQRAQLRDPSQPRAAQLLGEWSLEAREFRQANRYAALWVQAAPESEDARRFALKVKLLDESWHPYFPHRKAPQRAAVAESGVLPKVIVYGTSWCGFCQQARDWLRQHQVAFLDSDVEKDEAAQRELMEKEARAGVHFGGVPVIDVRGKLLEGFNPEAVRARLARP